TASSGAGTDVAFRNSLESCGREHDKVVTSNLAGIGQLVRYITRGDESFASPQCEDLLSYSGFQFAGKDKKRFVLARVYMRRWFSSGRQHCLHQKEGSVGILLFSEVGRQIPV